MLSLMFVLSSIGCSKSSQSKESNTAIIKPVLAPKKVFKEVADFPIIKDTAQFIAELRQCFEIEGQESAEENIQITFYKKVQLYGSDKDFILIEYSWRNGAMASFPWKHQLLLSSEGKPMELLSALRFEFVTVFPNQHPFLLTVVATAKGNGGHEIYKIAADTLQNVYEGYFDYTVQTYDAHQDFSVFEPNELKIAFTDENQDGWNDIVFTGEKLLLGKCTKEGDWYDGENGIVFSIENPAERISVKYVFLYDRQSGHFIAKENYEH